MLHTVNAYYILYFHPSSVPSMTLDVLMNNEFNLIAMACYSGRSFGLTIVHEIICGI